MKKILKLNFVKYFITGVSGFLIDLVVLTLATTLIFQGKNYSILGIMSAPKFISSTIALLFVFTVNRRWVFTSKEGKMHEQAIKFVIVCIFNVFLSSILYNFFYSLLEPVVIEQIHLANGLLILGSSLITEAIKMLSSYFLYKKVVFK